MQESTAKFCSDYFKYKMAARTVPKLRRRTKLQIPKLRRRMKLQVPRLRRRMKF